VLADLLNGFYLRPDPERFRAGAVWASEQHDFVADPDGASDVVDEEFLEGKLEALSQRVPGLEVDEVSGLVGYYDVTVQDWYPIVDRTDTAGYFVAIGTSGAWFKAGPVLGWLVSELVVSWLEGRDTDRDPLDPRLPLTGYPFPLSVFSRHRAPVALEYGGGVLG
jgi:sarcosine oxidase subunit beta